MSSQTNSVLVRGVVENDFQDWLPLWNAYQQFYEVNLPAEVTQRTWERFLEADEAVHSAVAVADGHVVGFANYLFHRSTWAENDYCYLEDLFVSPSARGRCVGKSLIEFVQQKAIERNSPRLYWHTHETNKTAQRLYDWIGEKPGFIEYRCKV